MARLRDGLFPDGMSEECRLLFERVRDIILFVAADGRIVEANAAAVEAYGRSRTELLSLRVSDIRAPETTGDISHQLAQALDGGVLFETRHLRADGTRFPVEVSSRRVDLAGETIVLSVVRDLSDRYEAQAEFDALNADLEQIFQTAADGMRIIDRDFNVLRANHTLARLSRVEQAVVAHGKCYETFPGDQCHTDECPLRRVLAGEYHIEMETEKHRSDGSVVPVLLRVQPYWRDGEVAGIVEDFRDITDRKRAEATIRHMAFHDQLTGLPNRALFHDRLSVALANAERDGMLMALMFLDIDAFKAVNDRHGHTVGDVVLAATGARLDALMRKGDTVARFGGDEFVVLLPHIETPDDAVVVAEKLVEGLSEDVIADGVEIGVSVSVGIALHGAGDTEDVLIRRADDAMYRAKQAGGDTYRFADDESSAVGA